MSEQARQSRVGCECDEGLRTPLNCWSCTARCATCGGERRIDLNANWHGPPGVERHHWIPCPDCAHLPESAPESPRSEVAVSFHRTHIEDRNAVLLYEASERIRGRPHPRPWRFLLPSAQSYWRQLADAVGPR